MTNPNPDQQRPVKLGADAEEVERHPAIALLLPVLFFLGLAASPFALAVGGVKDSAKAEFRRSTPFPNLAWSTEAIDGFPAGFEAWYRDAFGLRTELIKAYNWSSAIALGESPTPKFVIGKDRWIFHDEGGAVDTFRGVLPFSHDELEQWRAVLEQRSAWLASRGTTFLYAPIPSKLEVYPEQLPDHIRRLGVSRRTQLLQHLAQTSSVATLDLLPVLVAAKSNDEPSRHAYFPYGVHWTNLGARPACEAIAERLRELGVAAVSPGSLDDYKIVAARGPLDSLASRLHLQDYFTATESVLRPKMSPKAEKVPWKGRRHREDTMWIGTDDALPTVAVYHDSFGIWALPILANSFGKTYALRHLHFEPGEIAELAPDVVVQLQTERRLVSQLPMLLAGMGDDEFAAAFRGSDDVRLRLPLGEPLPFLPPFEDGTVEPLGSPGSQALRVDVRSGAAVVLTPTFDPAMSDGHLVLQLDLEAAAPGPAQLFFQTKADPQFITPRFYPFTMKKGRHTYHVPLSYRSMLGQLGIRFGSQPGLYTIHGLEVRAVD